MHRTFPVQDVDVSLLAADGRPHRMLPGRLRRGAGQVCYLEIAYSSPEVAAGVYGRTLDLQVNAAPPVAGVVTGVSGRIATVRIRGLAAAS